MVYLAYNWPKDPTRGDGLHVVASGDYGHTFAETEIPKLPAPSGYPDAWRIGYKLATAPDGSAYVAGYQLDLKHWHVSAPFAKGGNANIGRIAFGVARLRFDRVARRLTHGPNVLATRLPETAWNLGWTQALKGVNVGLAEPPLGDRPRRRFGRPHLLRDRRRRADPHRHERRPRAARGTSASCRARRRSAAWRSARCGPTSWPATGSSRCSSTRSTRKASDGRPAMPSRSASIAGRRGSGRAR